MRRFAAGRVGPLDGGRSISAAAAPRRLAWQAGAIRQPLCRRHRRATSISCGTLDDAWQDLEALVCVLRVRVWGLVPRGIRIAPARGCQPPGHEPHVRGGALPLDPSRRAGLADAERARTERGRQRCGEGAWPGRALAGRSLRSTSLRFLCHPAPCAVMIGNAGMLL